MEEVQPPKIEQDMANLDVFAQEREWSKLFSRLILETEGLGENLEGGTAVRESHTVEMLIQQLAKTKASVTGFSEEANLSPLDHLFVFAESTQSLLSKRFTGTQFQNFTQRINDTTLEWYRNFLRLPKSTLGSFYFNSNFARFELAQRALHVAYPGFASNGFQAFGNTLPVILSTRRYDWLAPLCRRLGLPKESVVCTESPTTLFDLTSQPHGLQVKPFLLIASAGGEAPDYFSDDLYQLRSCWLHVESTIGILSNASLSLYSSAKHPSQVKTNLMQTAHSLLFSCFSVLGYPPHRSSVNLLLFPIPEEASLVVRRHGDAADFADTIDYTAHVPNPDGSPCTLGLWFALQHVGCDDKLERADKFSKHLQQALIQEPSIEVLSDSSSHVTVFRYIPLRHVYKKIHEGREEVDVEFDEDEVKAEDHSDGVEEVRKNIKIVSESKEVKKKLEFDGFASDKAEEVSGKEKSLEEEESKEVAIPVPEKELKPEMSPTTTPKKKNQKSNITAIYSFLTRLFVNNVNKQIRNDINQTNAAVLDLNVFLGQDGNVYWIFDPYNNPDQQSITMEALEGFIHHLKLETQLIDESLDCRKLFHNLVSKFTSDGLFLSTIPNFVGVGAVRYVPPILKPLSEDEELCDELSREVDELNRRAISKLQETSNIFYEETDVNGLVSIAIHVDTSPMTKCMAYITQILDTVRDIEPEFNFLEKMGNLLSSSIKQVEERIKQEAQMQEAQVGIIRKIPLFGSVINWVSPINTPSQPGTSFNILTTQPQSPLKVSGSSQEDRTEKRNSLPLSSPRRNSATPPLSPKVQVPLPRRDSRTRVPGHVVLSPVKDDKPKPEEQQ